MAKPKMKVTSHFRHAERAGHEAIALALQHAVKEGEDLGKKRIETHAARRDYDLDPSSFHSVATPIEGVFSLGDNEEWWWRFFEFGTVHIKAMPSLRPAYNKARRVLLADLDTDFEGWIRKRAAVRRKP